MDTKYIKYILATTIIIIIIHLHDGKTQVHI